MIRKEINPGYDNFKYFIANIRNVFDKNGKTIKKDRNEVKIIKHKGVTFCVKSFGNAHRLNRLVYSFLRPSKAVRSFDYALKLLEMGIKTPDPVAYVEYYNRKGILQNSYYISVFQEYDYSLADVFEFGLSERLELLSQFSVYVCNELHGNGVFHKDLSAGNILIRCREEGAYDFFLIDLNRIRFRKKISFRMRMRNLNRINGTSMCLSTIAHFYALEYRRNPDWGAFRLSMERMKYKYYRIGKKKLKSLFRAASL